MHKESLLVEKGFRLGAANMKSVIMEVPLMKNVLEIQSTQVIMTFVATCIETTARMLNTSYKEVYERMKRVGLIERFILPHYEPLHSESRENLAQLLLECLNNWEGGR